ncbi:MAG TPA: sigma-70 family RNA polymerase sigma factor [Verrucomicrobiae bacterium]|jgi:RNA polymerase sigma-70 factor (ECF subfamily)|nr:sigma-70 family RNA polymerase sigma factor [Verrucomicrobiae bacterium]
MTTGVGISRAGTTIDSRLTIKDCQAVTTTPAPEPTGDSSLVLAARGGDRAAFGGLYARYARMVHGILLARVPANDVDDLVQDVFLRALPRLSDLRDVARFGPWLAAITRNRANDYYRQTRGVAAVTESLPEDEAHLPAANTSSDREAAMILALVRSLPETYREPLILRLVEGMTGPEIAARTGLTPGSVRVNLHRGMQQLREKLSQASLGVTNRPDSSGPNNLAPPAKNFLRRRNEL